MRFFSYIDRRAEGGDILGSWGRGGLNRVAMDDQMATPWLPSQYNKRTQLFEKTKANGKV
jgi:hypothetical protein